jgi:NAD-dependent deacetylase
MVKRRGARVIEVNPDETPVSAICDATFRGKSGEVLPALLESAYPRSS